MIVKVDADVDFEPDYFERADRRASRPTRRSRIASGTCYEREDGEWVRRTKADSTVWGATRAYRSDCLVDVDGARAVHGLGRARRDQRRSCAACRTQTFVDLPFRHHRPEGGRELSSLHQGEALGARRLVHGLPADATSRCARSTARAGSRRRSAMLWGYFGAAAAARPALPGRRGSCARCASASGSASTLRRGAPAS